MRRSATLVPAPVRLPGLLLLAIAWLVTGGVSPATAQAVDDIARELTDTGRYLEEPSSDALDEAIDDANEHGVAFAWLSGTDDPGQLAIELGDDLDTRTSRFPTVLVLTDDGVGASSERLPDAQREDALDASFEAFATGAVADGVTAFTAALPTTPTDRDGSGDGGGVPWTPILVAGALLVAVVAGIRALARRRRATQRARADLEADRAEIEEQLRDNADHVMELGDKVIASGRDDLQRLYEEASVTYQDVSHAIDGASTAAEIDALDDRIDRAEWQLESIEAQLQGRPVPPEPGSEPASRPDTSDSPAGSSPTTPGRPLDDDRPALGPDESVVSGRRPTTTAEPGAQSLSTASGCLGGMLGGGYGSPYGGPYGRSGGGWGSGGYGGSWGTPSRRTTRRRSGSPFDPGGGVFGPRSGRSAAGRRGSSRSFGSRGSGRSFGGRRLSSSGRRGSGRSFSGRRGGSARRF